MITGKRHLISAFRRVSSESAALPQSHMVTVPVFSYSSPKVQLHLTHPDCKQVLNEAELADIINPAC